MIHIVLRHGMAVRCRLHHHHHNLVVFQLFQFKEEEKRSCRDIQRLLTAYSVYTYHYGAYIDAPVYFQTGQPL